MNEVGFVILHQVIIGDYIRRRIICLGYPGLSSQETVHISSRPSWWLRVHVDAWGGMGQDNERFHHATQNRSNLKFMNCLFLELKKYSGVQLTIGNWNHEGGSPILQADSFPSELSGKPMGKEYYCTSGYI